MKATGFKSSTPKIYLFNHIYLAVVLLLGLATAKLCGPSSVAFKLEVNFRILNFNKEVLNLSSYSYL